MPLKVSPLPQPLPAHTRTVAVVCYLLLVGSLLLHPSTSSRDCLSKTLCKGAGRGEVAAELRRMEKKGHRGSGGHDVWNTVDAQMPTGRTMW